MMGETVVTIGGLPVLLRSQDQGIHSFLSDKYADFIATNPASPPYELTVEVDPEDYQPPKELCIEWSEGQWLFERHDFRANWSPSTGRGRVRQLGTAPHALDSVLRILHSIVVAREGGCLFHAASAVRNGKAFLFAGVSGAGKTTISSLLPPDGTLLTDEISYVRPSEEGYRAFGTPFSGALATPGDNVSAPLAAIYLLAKGPRNEVSPIGRTEAVAGLLRNILFFARDRDLVGTVFETACRIADRVPVRRLTFAPTPAVWELIG